jgi:hypothetical protein
MTLGIGEFRGIVAGITWGASFEKTLRFGFPLLDVKTYPLAREGTKVTRAMVAESDGWSFGHNHLIEFMTPAIPQEDEVDPYGYGAASGWDSPDGWADFLDWARRKIVVNFIPNLDAIVATSIPCYLVEPWTESPEAGWNLRRELRLVLRTLDDDGGLPVYFDGY